MTNELTPPEAIAQVEPLTAVEIRYRTVQGRSGLTTRRGVVVESTDDELRIESRKENANGTLPIITVDSRGRVEVSGRRISFGVGDTANTTIVTNP